jgi:SNF2 family DNA or RNA helicase
MNQSDLHPYQRGVVQHIIDTPYCGAFLDMGLGKTVSTLTAINTLIMDELEIDRVFIIAPKRVAENVWTAEQRKWEHLKHLKIVRVMGTEKQRKAALAQKAHIYVIGRDNTAWLCGLYGGGMLPCDMLVIDESSSFKNQKSIRFKTLKKTRPSLKRVVLLTGTPAPNGLLDLWPQLYLLDMGERLGKTVTAYQEAFFRKKYSGFGFEIRKNAAEEIHGYIGDICISMKASDYLDLPGRIDNYIQVPFDDKTREQYEDFERNEIMRLIDTDATILAVNAAALFNKLLQFANGAIYDAERNVHEIHKLKLDALDEIIEAANGKPVLVAWTYKHDRNRIMARLKGKAREMAGEAEINDWNAGRIPVMLMHPASGGHGLNLQSGGNIIVWFGQTPSLELYQQFNARLDRQGKTEPTIVNHLVVPGTLDMDVVALLARKEGVQEGLMQAVKVKANKYRK